MKDLNSDDKLSVRAFPDVSSRFVKWKNDYFAYFCGKYIRKIT